MPVGPYILCPEQTKKSQSSARTSTGSRDADCAPSTSTGTPRACASSVMARTGFTVPSAFERCVTATSRVRGPISASSASRSSSPAGVTRTARIVAPRRSAISCQGTRFEWCSISVTSTSSPARTNASPKLAATRLIPSVVPRVKMTSRASSAPRNPRACSRTASYAMVTCSLSQCTPRWMFAFSAA